MSGSQMPMAKMPKTMSSRLLTMKFMQRAAASASPITPDEPATKRQKLSATASPVTTGSDLQTAPASREVLDRQAAEAGETRWVLSFLEDGSETDSHIGLHVVDTAFAGLDDPKASELRDDEQDGSGWRSNSIVGRKNFGNFKRAPKNTKEPPQDEPEPSSDKVSDSEDDDDDGDDDDEDHRVPPNNGKDTGSRGIARERAMKEAKKKSEEQRKEKRLLRGISSISGSGGLGEHGQTVKRKDVQCYKCGRSGHVVRDCTNRRAIPVKVNMSK